MPDGKITFSTALDNKEMEKELKDVEKGIEKATAEKGKATGAKLPLEKRLESLNEQLEVAKNNLEEYRQRVSDAEKTIHSETATPEDIAAAKEALQEDQSNLSSQEAQIKKLEEKWEAVNQKIREYDAVIENADARIEEGKEKAGEMRAELSGAGTKLRDTMEEAGVSIDKIKKRIAGLASRVFVFTMITKALRVARDYFGNLLEKNQEFQAQLAKLRGALATAFQPLFEAAVPVLITIMEILTKIAMVAAHVISLLFGKTASQSAKNAKALNSEAEAIKGVGTEAKEASKQLAGFDEINKLDAQDTGAGGTGGISGMEDASKFDFSEFDTEAYKNKIDELTVYLSGALLALGAILAFSGANVPLGLGLMAAGAISLAAVVAENWGAVDSPLKQAVTRATIIVGTALLAIGAILLVTGNIPLGIALIIAGIGASYAAAKLDYNVFANTVKTVLDKVQGYMQRFLNWIDDVFVYDFTILFGPLIGEVLNRFRDNLHILVDGVVGIVQGLLNIIGGLMTRDWSMVWEGAVQIMTGFANGVIAIANTAIGIVVDFINIILDSANAVGKIFGRTWNLRITAPQISHIPALAQGAVIPPNAPFIAMLGDQRSGTNIETPEALLRQIVREESESALMREQNALLRQILEKTGVYLDGKTLSDTVTRYQSRQSRAMGV